MLIYNKNRYRVYKLKTFRCNCYVIIYRNNVVLVDTSIKSCRESILEQLKDIGVKKVDAIVLTHTHSDHAGNARYFSNLFKCSVYVSQKGLDSIRSGYSILPKGTMLYSRFITGIYKAVHFLDLESFPEVKYAKPIDNEIIKRYLGKDVSIPDTPGHTSDSISIVICNQIALVGDSMVNMLGMTYPPFADDEESIVESWGTLLSLDCNRYYPAHGSKVKRRRLERAFVEKKYI